MGYFDQKRNAEKYIRMMSGFDNAWLIDAVFDSLPSSPGKSLLELGMGPGNDLLLLKKAYDAVGSDTSRAFLDAYRKKDPDTPILKLDAASLATDLTFDYIYSNKVLIHLDDAALAESFKNQAARLNPGGMVFHTFWHGTGEKSFHGMLFNYHQPEEIIQTCRPWFKHVRTVRYTELDEDDSFYIVLAKKATARVAGHAKKRV